MSKICASRCNFSRNKNNRKSVIMDDHVVMMIQDRPGLGLSQPREDRRTNSALPYSFQGKNHNVQS